MSTPSATPATDAAPSASDELIGRTVCGCQIIRLIGQGGMGNLYVARQLSLDRVVAVKILSPSLSSNTDFLGRFRREARALARLLHPNIVAVHDFGEDGHIHAIIMECVDGESVADMLAHTNVIDVATSVEIVRQVAEGLACAHDHGVIHCDLKPENILVTSTGVAKVVDFGLAKSLRGDAMRITQDGSILGTPTYMSPEQCEGRPLDARTDIYSLGATFYRMMAGVDVFDGENAFAIMLKHKEEPPMDPRRYNADITPRIARVIVRMLEKRREDRYQSAHEVVAALSEGPGTGKQDKATTEEVIHPRHDLIFVRAALAAGVVAPEQVRACLAEITQRHSLGFYDRVAEVMARRGFLTEEQADRLEDTGEAKEAAHRDQQFARFVLDAGLATSAQVSHCIRQHQHRRSRGQFVKLSKVMVEEGVLDQQQVVALLLRQLKDAQRREDGELVELIRSHRLLSDSELERCALEQRRQAAKGHHRVLRQIVVELDMLPASQVRELLAGKVRADIEALLAEHEGKGLGGPGVLGIDESSLKLEETDTCAACGKPVQVGARACPACGAIVEKVRREAARLGVEVLAEATDAEEAGAAPVDARPEQAERRAKAQARAPAGTWEFRLPDGEASKPVSLQALARLAREKRLKPTTVLRGPLTNGIWRQARHTPRLCRLFGVCHFCEEELPPKARQCPSCGASPDKPVDD